MNTKQTHTAQQNFLFLALLQAEYAKQKNVTEELLNILLLVVYATRLCKNENCLPGMDASDENCREFAKANSIAQTAGTPFERYELNYNLDYEYDSKFVHRAKRIGKQHYLYDLNGNLISEQEGAYNENEPDAPHEVIQTGNLYSVDYGWGIVNPDAQPTSTPNITRRNYTWNERNLLKTSTDRSYSVQYHYGADGQRSAKYSVGSNGVSETLYFNKMWNWRYDSRIMQRDGRVSKHIYLGETRILTKLASASNDLSAIVSEELTKQYYYHTDHLGSAQLISDCDGKEYERIEYTPYGELWIEKKTTISQIDIPFRFTGKERDEETGLYYYGARYLDAKTSRWLSTDPALGEYIPGAPVNDETKKRNKNLPNGGIYNTISSHLYNYANNNPVKYTDPDGRIAFYSVNTDTQVITVTIPVKFADGTTQAQKDKFKSATESFWSGGKARGFTVNIKVQEVSTDKYNTVSFVDTTDPDKDISNVDSTGLNMTLYSGDLSPELGDKVIAHEAGHLMDLPDQYSATYDENGNRTATTPNTNSDGYDWSNNIMGTLGGSAEARNYADIVNALTLPVEYMED